MPTLVSRTRPVKTAQSSKPLSRTFCWLYRHPGDQLKGAVRMAIAYVRRTDHFRYWIERIPSDFGIAFQLKRIEPDGKTGDTDYVCIENARDAHCDCKGHESHGHCKHVDAARAIIATEKLS